MGRVALTVAALVIASSSCAEILGLEGNPEVRETGFDPDAGNSARCGDDNRDEGEVCDDGNTADGDGCRGDCLGIEICGDDLEDFGENCDDGNLVNGDGCRDDCTVELCGDGIPDPGELCFRVAETLLHELPVGEAGPSMVETFLPVPADVDGDGEIDLSILSADENSQDVFLVSFGGDGLGGFGEPVQRAFQTIARRHLLLADLDGIDGPDAYVQMGRDLGRIQNDGLGSFGSPQVSQILDGPGSTNAYDIGDVQGDGHQDIFAIRHNPQTESGTLFVVSGNSSLDMDTVSTFNIGNGPVAIEVVDLNGDGRDDVAILGSSGGALSELRIFLGADQVLLSPQLPVATLDNASSVVAADVDGDGDPDLAIAGNSGTGLQLLRNQGSGDFVASSLPVPQNYRPFDLEFGDLDGDGDEDLVGFGHAGGRGGLVTFENDGDGVFAVGSTQDLLDETDAGFGTTQFFGLTLVDLNGDLRPEPVVSWGIPSDVSGALSNQSLLSVFELDDL